MLVTDTKVYFFGKADPFSNWNPSPMSVPLAPGTRALDFVGGEQLFMAWKALHFADYATLVEVLKTVDPAAQKALGKKVKPFDEDEWDRVSPRYMFKVAIAKYDQSPRHRAALLDANGRTFVEASPYDRTWGVGLGQDDPRVLDEANWKGVNWLGLVHDMAYGLFAERDRRSQAGDGSFVVPKDFFRPESFVVGPKASQGSMARAR